MVPQKPNQNLSKTYSSATSFSEKLYVELHVKFKVFLLFLSILKYSYVFLKGCTYTYENYIWLAYFGWILHFIFKGDLRPK